MSGDSIHHHIITEYLTNANYSVTSVMNELEIIDIVNKKDLDCLLLDIMMPNLIVFKVCRKLRKIFSQYDLPIILIMSNSNTTDLTAGFDAGINDYLTTPIDKNELLARVNTLVTMKKSIKRYEDVKFKLLRRKMNPYFLFNMLHIIHSLISTNDELADIAVLKLAQNFRFILEQPDSTIVSFEDEWRFMINYLELERLRFQDRLFVQIGKNGNFDDILIPSITLQPIVEKLIEHGIFNIDQYNIRINAERKDNEVFIEITDNGTGLQPEKQFTRILDNIRERLEYYYERAELKIENMVDGGVMVNINFQF